MSFPYSEIIGDDADVAALLSAGDDDGDDTALVLGDDDPETGGQEIVGADFLGIGDDEILEIAGASPKVAKALAGTRVGRLLAGQMKLLAKKQASRKAAARLAVRNNRVMAVQPQRVTTRGGSPAGFKKVIAAGASEVIAIQPPVAFLPLRLMIPSSIAGAFELTGLTIGQTSYLVGGTAVPCMAFEEKQTGQNWGLPTVQIGQIMNMLITNVSGADATVAGVWFGKWFG